jgi:hypothetical protein
VTDREHVTPLATWPRLLDLHLAAQYLSVGESTVRDYIADGLLTAVQLPGSTLRDKAGNIVAHARARRISKILLDKADLDKLIDQRKGAE